MDPRWHSQSEADLPREADWLSALERERAAAMRFAKRRMDYLLGRWTAKCAVARALDLGRTPAALAAIEVRNARDGAPEAFVDGVPAALAISLTDRAGWGVCAVHGPGVAVGCDLELVEPRSEAFVADYLTAAERGLVATAMGEEERHRLANLIWSAKESALKVLRTGLRRDTRSVEVELDADADGARWSPLRVYTSEGARFPGWWRRFGPFLLTFAASRPTPPPAALVEPPSLARAVPTHAWLRAPVREPRL